MATVPMISVGATTGLLDSIVATGGDPDRVLGAVGLDRCALAEADGFIPASSFSRILEESARATGDALFGLHFAERFDPRDVGALAYVALNSPTISAAIANIVRYMRIHNQGATVRFDAEEGLGCLRYVLAGDAGKSPRQHNEYSMVIVLKAFRSMAGSRWTPQEIQFAHESPDQISEHVRVFGCVVTFERPFNAMVFEQHLMERTIAAADSRLYRILKQHVERVLNEIPHSSDFVAGVSRAVAKSMGEGAPGLGRVAADLAMSSRTLERRLKQHGVVFKDLLTDIRRRMAIEYLGSAEHRLAEIAFLLGYSEVSAFNRAFKRWTGVSPLQYRAGKRAG